MHRESYMGLETEGIIAPVGTPSKGTATSESEIEEGRE